MWLSVAHLPQGQSQFLRENPKDKVGNNNQFTGVLSLM